MDTLQSTIGIARYLLPFLLLGVGSYFARRFVLALERRVENKADLAELRARIAELEEARDASDREVMRLQAAHEFSVQLLAARAVNQSSADFRK